MIVKLLTEHHLEFLSLKGGCRGSSKSTHVKMSHCWKSHALSHFILADCRSVVSNEIQEPEGSKSKSKRVLIAHSYDIPIVFIEM